MKKTKLDQFLTLRMSESDRKKLDRIRQKTLLSLNSIILTMIRESKL